MKTLPSALSHSSAVLACFTTRSGGVSSAPYESANLAFHVGDDPLRVTQNHDLLSQHLGYERSRLVHMRQIHSDHVVAVDETFGFDTPPECDALITDRSCLPLMVMSADCTPILLHDPHTHAIGAVHAGREGALKAILPKTIAAMGEAYGTRAENIRISMGPSIGGCCYEINPAIASEVTTLGYQGALRREGEKVFLDVNAILLRQLETAGVNAEAVEVLAECTACRCDTYFSYRADARRTGRIAGVIMLR
ncbi:MAG: peptidoglycan editing factor PgeF [Campylobacterota bacterium]